MTHQASSKDADRSGCWLSICIATRNRCSLLLQTLASVMEQANSRIEIVVVDGASDDSTQAELTRLAAANTLVRYFREEVNGGIDRDYDKAVGYARGTYCWLMSDDDLFLPGAIARVLDATASTPSLVVVDAEVRDASQSRLLLNRRLSLYADRYFGPDELELLFKSTGGALSFIGSTVIERSMWMERKREPYFGSYFVHFGVIFQHSLPRGAMVLTRPCLSIRYGNASWSARSFEIWMFKWPNIVWSMVTLTSDSKMRVVAQRPYESFRELILLRAKGAYSFVEYKRWLAPLPNRLLSRVMYMCVALTPGALINLMAVTYVLVFSRARAYALVDLLDSPYFVLKYFRCLYRK